MLRRHILAAAGATLAAPAIVSRGVLGQTLRKVKMGSAFTTTTNAAFLMPDILKPEGIDLELVMFPSLVQRMQAVASGDVDIGNGGLSATMQVAKKCSLGPTRCRPNSIIPRKPASRKNEVRTSSAIIGPIAGPAI